jgi:hypothetical protein
MTTFIMSELTNGRTIMHNKFNELTSKAPTQTDLKEDLVKASQNATTGGRKFDGGKPQYGLLPPLALKATVEILTFGAEKYEPDNWKYVPDSKRRYFDSVQRHLWAWKEGEQTDPESGKNHLAHAICGLMFLFEHDVEYSLDK